MFLGIDIGGTYTKAGLLDRDGNILAFAETDTPKTGGVQAEIASISEILDFFEEPLENVKAIGVGIPGPVDYKGVVFSPPNLNHWGKVDLGRLLSEFFHFPAQNIIVGNDANFAGLAEYKFGNGAQQDPMIMITLGTGVGGAIIIDGEIFHGRNGFAGELGHIVLQPDGPRCGCGRRGCAESFLSHQGIVRIAWEILQKDKGSILWEMIGGEFELLTPKTIQEASNMGDPASCKILDKVSRFLGIFLADLINIFNPQRIVIGGGISKWGKPLIEPAEKVAKKQAMKHIAENVNIVRAKFYQKAGVIGAASAAMSVVDY
ncbi:hypothetical protein DRQ33_03630 [bacterium]|nr:MAG: hypothetical protein DRQ33_03630 [bacterium]